MKRLLPGFVTSLIVAPVTVLSSIYVIDTKEAVPEFGSVKNNVQNTVSEIVNNINMDNGDDVNFVLSIINDIKNGLLSVNAMNSELGYGDIDYINTELSYEDHFLEALNSFDLGNELSFQSEDDRKLPENVTMESVVNDLINISLEIADESFSIQESKSNRGNVMINESILEIGGQPTVDISIPKATQPIVYSPYNAIEVGDIFDFFGYQDDLGTEKYETGSWQKEAFDNFIGHTSTVVDTFIDDERNKTFILMSSKPSTNGVYFKELNANEIGEYLSVNDGEILRVGKKKRVSGWWLFSQYVFEPLDEWTKEGLANKVMNMHDEGGYDYHFKLWNNKWYCSEIPAIMYLGTDQEFFNWGGAYPPRGITFSSKTKRIFW